MIHKQVFDKAFEVMQSKGWDSIAVAVDLHDTVFKPTYSEELATEFFPNAKETLQLMSQDPRIKMYMYTCTPQNLRLQYKKVLAENGIVIETTPGPVMDSMGIKANAYQDYNTKPYFNVLLDDKAGFDPDHDWVFLLTYFKLQQQR